MNRERRQSGGEAGGARRAFSLIEVLLATAILGMSLAGLLTAATRALAVLKASAVYQEAAWTLSLAELEHPLELAAEPEDVAVSPESYPNGLTYTREIGEDGDEDGLYVVRSRVSWEQKGRQAVEDVVQYLYFEPETE